MEPQSRIDVRFHAQEMAAAPHALDPATEPQGLLHQREMLADDALFLNRGFANRGVELAQAEHPACSDIVVEVSARALAKGVQSAGGVAVVGIDDEIAGLLAEHHQEQIQVQQRDIGHGEEEGGAGSIRIPLVERQHEGNFTGISSRDDWSRTMSRSQGWSGPAASATKKTPSSFV